jgi:hypothetical protein
MLKEQVSALKTENNLLRDKIRQMEKNEDEGEGGDKAQEDEGKGKGKARPGWEVRPSFSP